MSCPLLSQIQALPVGSLITSALKLLDPADFKTFHNAYRHPPTTINKAHLAEVIYYQLGKNMAAQQKWNDMTRLQLEHELRWRALLEEGEVLTDWKLRLRLAGAAFRERQEIEQRLEEVLKVEDPKVEDEAEEYYELKEDSDKHGDLDQKVIYTKSNGRTMVY